MVLIFAMFTFLLPVFLTLPAQCVPEGSPLNTTRVSGSDECRNALLYEQNRLLDDQNDTLDTLESELGWIKLYVEFLWERSR